MTTSLHSSVKPRATYLHAKPRILSSRGGQNRSRLFPAEDACCQLSEWCRWGLEFEKLCLILPPGFDARKKASETANF